MRKQAEPDRERRDGAGILRPREYFGWEATAAPAANPSRGLVIHYNGRPTGLDDHADCVAYWKDVRAWHMTANGWLDIGYSFGVCPHGETFTGRGLQRYQAAQGTVAGNSDYYSVSLMLGEGEYPMDAQIDGVIHLRSRLMRHGVGSAVKGHRDFLETRCPGPIIYRLVTEGVFCTERDIPAS